MPGQLESWIAIIAGVISVGSLFYSWLTWRSRYNAKKINAIEARQEEHEEQTSQMEQRLSGEIRSEVGRVHSRVDDVAKSINTVEGEVRAIGKTVNLINKHLLDQAGKKSCCLLYTSPSPRDS